MASNDAATVVKSEPPDSEASSHPNPTAAPSDSDTASVKLEQMEADALEQKPQPAQQAQPKWPGWPGDNVFRLIVPVMKVGAIIGRKGELVKKMCDETRARIRILEGPLGSPDRIVLISGKEEPDTQLSPAMDAALRVFKRVSGLSTKEGDDSSSAATGAAFCSIRLLVASSQAIHLIGKQGSTIRSIQESSGASVRVLSEDEVRYFASSDERVVEIHGEAIKVFNALESVLVQLRKFLVDHSVLPVFEKTSSATISQDHSVDTWADKTQSSLRTAAAAAPTPASRAGLSSEYSLSLKHDPSIYDHERYLEPKIPQSGLSLYGQDHGLGGLRSAGLSRTATPIVTQVTQTMQVPLSYAEDIIGVGGSNIAHIRRSSGAILTIQESRGLPDEITVEIKGTTSQVQRAQQLIQEFTSSHKEPESRLYGKIDPGMGTYSQLEDDPYPSSSFASRIGGYGSSGLGGYGSPGIGGYTSYRY